MGSRLRSLRSGALVRLSLSLLPPSPMHKLFLYALNEFIDAKPKDAKRKNRGEHVVGAIDLLRVQDA